MNGLRHYILLVFDMFLFNLELEIKFKMKSPHYESLC